VFDLINYNVTSVLWELTGFQYEKNAEVEINERWSEFQDKWDVG